MSSEYRWFLPERIIYAELSGEITTEDLHKGNEAISRFLYESPADSVHLIFDAHQMTGIAFNIVSVWGILSYLRHPRLKWVIMMGAKRTLVNTIKIFVSIISAATRFNFYMCNHLIDAIAFLQKQDGSLPDLSSIQG